MAKKGAYENLKGVRFGRWVCTDLAVAPFRSKEGKQHSTKWKCLCDCGTEAVVTANSLKTGQSKSCGCLNAELIKARSITHGMSKTFEYNIWLSMRSRILDKSSKSYKDYGGRGILIHPDWVSDFKAFFDHIGPRPSADYSLERIDNNGNYEPGNVKWASRISQANNKRSNRKLTLGTETKTLAEWCKEKKLRYKTVHARLTNGWSVERSLMTPTVSV